MHDPASIPPDDTKRVGAAAVGDQDLQRGEIFEDLRIEQADDGDAFFVDEVERIGEAFAAAAGGVDVAGDVELDELFVEGIPEAVAEGRRVTYDLKPSRDDPTAVGTSEYADAIIEKLEATS